MRHFTMGNIRLAGRILLDTTVSEPLGSASTLHPRGGSEEAENEKENKQLRHLGYNEESL